MLAQQWLTFYINTSFKQQHIFKTGTHFDFKASATVRISVQVSPLYLPLLLRAVPYLHFSYLVSWIRLILAKLKKQLCDETSSLRRQV